MSKWSDFLNTLLEKRFIWDDVKTRVSERECFTGIPPIIKASLMMLEQMNIRQEQYNAFVFPEKEQTIFFFILFYVLQKIKDGKIATDYNPYNFKEGERLKYKNCVVAFSKIDNSDGQPRLWVRTADTHVGAPIEMVPLFDRTSTKRLLSKDRVFSSLKAEFTRKQQDYSPVRKTLSYLFNHKTHMTSSVYMVSSTHNIKSLFLDCQIDSEPLNSLLLLGNATFEGETNIIGAGQLVGIPSIVFASNLYSVFESLKNDTSIHSIIVNIPDISDHLSALDDLIKTDIPIIFTTCTSESFELNHLANRNFNIWRWDSSNLATCLCRDFSLESTRKIKNAMMQEIKYVTFPVDSVSEIFGYLYAQRIEIQEQSANMITVFNKLYTLAFFVLRAIIPFTEAECARNMHTLDECERLLGMEKNYITFETNKNYIETITKMKKIFSSRELPKKFKTLCEKIDSIHGKTVAIIISEKSDKTRCQQFWIQYCRQMNMNKTVCVLYPEDFLRYTHNIADVAFISGWLGNKVMRKILYSFNTQEYYIFLYHCERLWKSSHTRIWDNMLSNHDNAEIIQRSLGQAMAEPIIAKPNVTEQDTEPPDEIDEINMILRGNKYRKYIVRDGQKSGEEVIEAIPINFSGDVLVFFRLSRKVITATQIMQSMKGEIELKVPVDLQTGDFVVFRETERDIIKEIADAILIKSGKPDSRTLSKTWKEALAEKNKVSSIAEIHKQLIDIGCRREPQTIRAWLADDRIAPHYKEDLIHIGKITNNEFLMENIDMIFDAAKEVRSAHMQAGNNLSELLRSKLAAALHKMGDVDPQSINGSITLSLDNVGTVKVFKVTDIGHVIMVNAGTTNRLIYN